MFLYNLTLQRATGISYAIHGNFSGNFSLLRASWLELFQIVEEKMHFSFSWFRCQSSCALA